MSGHAIPRNYVKNAMQNGIGRYICQLQRITFKFCKSNVDSKGMRDFIEKHMLDFAHGNPGVVVYLKPRRHRSPNLVAEYLNGRTEIISTKNMAVEEICKWLEHLRSRSGVQIVRLVQHHHTDISSVQGIWHPFLNKDPSLAATTLPAPELYRAPRKQKSATEMLLEKALIRTGEENVVKKLGSVENASCKE